MHQKCKITFIDKDLQRKCQAHLDKAVLKTIKLTLKWLHKKIEELVQQSKNLKKELSKKFTKKEFKEMNKKMENKKLELERKMNDTKTRKLDNQIYEYSNPHMPYNVTKWFEHSHVYT